MMSNRTLGEKCHDAIVDAATAKVEAIRARKLADRIFDRVFLASEGKNLDERRANARLDPKFISAEDAAIEAESAAIIAKAQADGQQISFAEWQSKNATARAEMQLR